MSTPGPNGRQTLDCGCWRDNLMQYRCQLHAAAPEMLAILQHAGQWALGYTATTSNTPPWAIEIRALLARIAP